MATTEKQRRDWSSPFDVDAGRDFAERCELLSYSSIAEAWRAMSGEQISRERVRQIIRTAEKKIMAQVADLEGCETLL